MLKTYAELSALDVTPYVDKRKGKDDSGKTIEIPYLNWAMCTKLLHDNGAESVYFTPVKAPNGSFVFVSAEVENKDGRKCGCYFVAVEIHIDDKVFTMDMPLMNGSNVVYADTLNQLRISNAHARAFVKGVAIHTGLGFSLWLKDSDTEPPMENPDNHSIFVIKERVERLITQKMQKMTEAEMLDAIGINQKMFRTIMASFQNVNALEQALKKL